MGYTSANLTTGAVRNPYDQTRIPGGSSGGSAAAVAARLAPLSVAEDTAGSIRVPAAMCGIVGFRPTTGRYPSRGVMPMTPLFDQLGPHARSVSDVILFDAVVTGDRRPIAPTSLRGIRLGVVRNYYYADLDSEVSRLMEDALRRLIDAGATIIEMRIPDLEDLAARTAFPIILHDLAPSIAAYLREFGAGVSVEQLFTDAGNDIKGVLAATTSTIPSDADYRTLVSITRPMLQAHFASAFKSTGVRAIVFPMTPIPPVPITQGPTISVRGNQYPSIRSSAATWYREARPACQVWCCRQASRATDFLSGSNSMGLRRPIVRCSDLASRSSGRWVRFRPRRSLEPQGKILPGFRMPFGSNAALTRFISAISSGDSSIGR